MQAFIISNWLFFIVCIILYIMYAMIYVSVNSLLSSAKTVAERTPEEFNSFENSNGSFENAGEEFLSEVSRMNQVNTRQYEDEHFDYDTYAGPEPTEVAMIEKTDDTELADLVNIPEEDEFANLIPDDDFMDYHDVVEDGSEKISEDITGLTPEEILEIQRQAEMQNAEDVQRTHF